MSSDTPLEVAARIREEYLEIAETLPEEKDNIREAIIDAAEAGIEGIDEVDIATPIKELNAAIDLLIAQLRKEKVDMLATIEDARATSIKEIRDEESLRLAEYRQQLSNYHSGIEVVRKEISQEIKDKPDSLVKEILDLTIKRLDSAHYRLRVDTKNGKTKLVDAFSEARRRTVTLFYDTKTQVYERNRKTLGDIKKELPKFVTMIKGTFEKVSVEAQDRMVKSVKDYLNELDNTVRQTISRLKTEKNKAANELNSDVTEVLNDCKEIVTETLLEMKVEAAQIATEYDVTYYARRAVEWLASLAKVLLKIVGYILLAIVAIIALILLIIVLIVTGVIDLLVLIVSTILRYLLPMFVRWLGQIILQFLRRVVAQFIKWIVKKVGQELLKAIGKFLAKWIGRALVTWGLYEGVKYLIESTREDLSPSEREDMIFDGVVIIGTSVIAEWKLIKTLYKGKTSYKAFKNLSKLTGDAKVANKLLTAAKGDMQLATSIAKRMDSSDLGIIIDFVDNAADLERALTLTGNNGKALLNLMESTGNFKKVVTLLDKSGGDTALLNRLLPKFNSADELIVMLDRVKDPAKLEKLLGVTKDVSKLSDDALKGLLKMSDDELLALQGKNIVEIEAAVINKGLNLEAVQGVGSRYFKSIDEFKAAITRGENVFFVGKHSDIKPRPIGVQSHHGVNTVWMDAKYSNYSMNKAPSVYMLNNPNHNATRGVFNTWRSEIAKQQGVNITKVDYSIVTKDEILKLAEQQFNAADVPKIVRDEYYKLWEDYIKTLKPR